MSIEFKPNIETQKVIGQMILNGWTKEKIIKWWKSNGWESPVYGQKVLKWIEENV